MGVLEFADQSEFFEIDRWWVQCPVIYEIFSRLNHNSFRRYRASLAESYTDRRKKEESKSEDRRFAHFSNLPVWYFSDALQHIYNGPIAHGSTQ